MAKKANKEPVADTQPLKRIELTEGVLGSKKIHFKWMTQKYGHAEFIVCAVYRRGYIREAFITPAQQEGTQHYYHIKGKWQGIHIGGYLHKLGSGASVYNYAKMWCSGYCPTHKGISYRMYVPTKSGCLSVSTGLGNLVLTWGSADEVSLEEILEHKKELKKPVKKARNKKKK